MPGRRNRSESRSRSRSRDSSYGGEETRVHIADVSVNCSKRELEDEFKKFGPLSEIWMARTPPCFAFAVYRNREDAEDAVRGMNGASVGGSRIRVSIALPRAHERNRRPTFDSSMRCYQCGERGHFARDCNRIGHNRNRWSPPRRNSTSVRHRKRSSSSKSHSRSRSKSHDKSRDSRRRRSEEKESKRSKDRKSREKRSSSKKDKERTSSSRKREKGKETTPDHGDNDNVNDDTRPEGAAAEAGGGADGAESASP